MYKAIIFDEYADLDPKEEEMGRMVRALLSKGLIARDARLIVTSAALDKEEVRRLIGSTTGEVGLVFVSGRKYTMHRCIVAPPQTYGLPELVAHLALKAIERNEEINGAT